VMFDFRPHKRTVFSSGCNIQLYSLSYENTLLFLCIVLPSSSNNLKFYVNVTWGAMVVEVMSLECDFDTCDDGSILIKL
jgi:hypothetical protein